MASLNKVMLIGHLGRDPEVRYTTGGDAVCTLALATSEQWKDKDGEKQERTEWHRVVLWGRRAEVAGEHLKKGAQVFVEGSLRTNKYTDKDGVEKYATEINGQDIRFLSRPNEQRQQEQKPQQKQEPSKKQDDFDDDIPFN